MIKCGFAEISITPALGSVLPGYYHERRSTGVTDELFAKAMVLDDGRNTLAVIALDAIAIEKEAVWAIRESIFEKTAISRESIMVCCTHAHTTGATESWGEEVRADEGYLRYLVKKTTDAVCMANDRKKLVRIGFGTGREAEISFNRRYYMKDGSIQGNPGIKNPDIVKPAGPIDPEVAVMRIDDPDGNPVGVVSNFACHCDTVGAAEYCADFPGEVSRCVRKNLGEHVVSMLLVGASGDINHIDVSGKFDASGEAYPPGHFKRMGRILGYEVLKVRDKISTGTDIPLEAVMRIRKAETMKPGKEDRSIAEKVVKTIPYSYEKLSQFDEAQIELFFAREILRMLNDPETGKPAEMEIQVFRIGEMGLAAYPVELFVELGLELKRKSPFAYTMISTNSNGRMTYVYTPEALAAGSRKYQTLFYDRCSTGFLAAGNGREMIEETLRMLGDLFFKKSGRQL